MANKDLKRFVETLKNIVSFSQKEVKKDLNKGYLKAVAEDLNIEQLKKGQKANGEFLPEYSETSIEVYGKPAGRIKLYDTGEFYEKITAEVRQDKLYITDYSPKLLHKPAQLANRYGYEIVGLTDKNVLELQAEIEHFLLNKLKQKIF